MLLNYDNEENPQLLSYHYLGHIGAKSRTLVIKYNFKSICDRVFGGETIIVSRPKNENIVLLSEKKYEELERAQRNADYLAKLDRGFEQMKAGKLQYHELLEADE